MAELPMASTIARGQLMSACLVSSARCAEASYPDRQRTPLQHLSHQGVPQIQWSMSSVSLACRADLDGVGHKPGMAKLLSEPQQYMSVGPGKAMQPSADL